MNYHELPVYKQKEKILDALAANQVIVVESPTGSGKTTQIPKILYDAGYAKNGMIGVTQPRRIAAVSVTEYIARQLGKIVPDTVGYKMRFHDITDERTKIKIMTDGTLLQEIKADYDLSRYSIIMVDEAHERSLNIDFILGLLKRILERRPEFKVIISSATINPEVFQLFFEGCPIVNIETSMYPVDIHYTPPKPENDYDAMIFQIADIVAEYTNRTPEGDILIFLSGEKPIKDTTRAIEALPGRGNLEILPLYARLSSEEQERVFQEFPGKRKIIIATNIAETSITIDGVTLVIDCGLAKVNYYNPHTFTSSLVEMPISRAAAKQRRGRAGRTRPGECYRLYSKQDYEHRPLYTMEEILRTDLSEVVLRMAEIKIRDFENFEFISPPPPHGLASAIDTLYMMDALDNNRDLTPTGKMMAEFPLLPKHSRIIVEAILRYPNVIEEILIASSFLTVNTPFLLPQGQEMEARKAHHFFRHALGDFVSYLKMFRAYQDARDKDKFCDGYFLDRKVMDEIINVKSQLEEIVSKLGIPVSGGGGLPDYICAIARGLIQFVCVRMGRSLFRSITAAKIQIHPGSGMYGKEPQYIVAGEVVRTSRMYARSVSVIEEAWLPRIHPNLKADLARKHRDLEHEAIGGGAGKGEARDFTNQIRIGSEVFKIVRVKGKKIVQLPWEQLQKLFAAKNGNAIPGRHSPDFKKLHGTVVYDGHEIMHGLKLNTILEVFPRIKMEKGILPDWPRHKHMIMPHHKEFLLNILESLMHLCRRRKKEKDLGFLSLTSDGAGTYWFISEKSFYAALSCCLASLESLADLPEGVFTEKDISEINRTFRKLSELMEK